MDQLVDLALTLRSPQVLYSVGIYRCAPPGFRSRDRLLSDAAKAHQLKPTSLETGEQVDKRQRRKMPDEFYAAEIYEALRPEGEAEGDMSGAAALRGTVIALNSGDFDAVARAVRATIPSPAYAQMFENVMVSQRNVMWMDRLPALLDDGSAVIVVGAYHLPGPNGLVALLRERGYTVKPTLLSAMPAQSFCPTTGRICKKVGVGRAAGVICVRPDAHFATRSPLPLNWGPNLVTEWNAEAEASH